MNNNNPFFRFVQNLFGFTEGFQETTIIPKKIFQTWHSTSLPPKMSENIDSLKEKHPDFDYYFFDDDSCRRFIELNFEPSVVAAFDQLIPGAYKADLWRYCVLYIHGGIYMDIKFNTTPNVNLSQFLNREYFVRDLVNDNMQGVYNGFMVCKPKNPILLKCIKQIVEHVQNNFYGNTFLEITGPHLLMKYFTKEEIENMELALDVKVIGMHNIILDGLRSILSTYPEYRNEQQKHQKNHYYPILWSEKQVYKFSRLTRTPFYQNSIIQ